MNLYELTQQKLAFLNEIEQFDSEDWEHSDVIADTLDALDEAINDKVESVAAFIKSMEHDVLGMANEIKRLQERKKLHEAKVERMKLYLHDMLEAAEIDKVSGSRFTISFRRSTTVEVDDVEELDIRYKRIKTVIEADKTALKNALKDGEVVEGARLVERRNLAIK